MANAMPNTPLIVGWEEWVTLPKLGLPAVLAKVDSGAKTSSLHAHSIEIYGTKRNRVRFKINPVPSNPALEVCCSAKLVAEREITSSNGESELRPIIETTIELGGEQWPIEISLTNRETMAYKMLIGRTTMADKLVIEPQASCLNGEKSFDVYDDLPVADSSDRQLNIAVLSREPNNYSTRRLVEAAEERGHDVTVIDTLRCYMSINADSPDIHIDGHPLPAFDAVIPRIGTSITFYGMAVVRQFEMMGVYCLNTSSAIGCSRDKLFAHQLLARKKVPMPNTGFAHSPKDTKSVIELIGKAPFVLKLLEGTQGKGVVLAETKKAAESVMMAFQNIAANILVQEFVPEAKGADIRLFVVGNKVLAAMKRQAGEGEFRSNLHMGGHGVKVKITPLERKIAVRSAKALGLRVAGVDILRTANGPEVIEVNSSPGLEGIETVTGKDVAGTIVDYIERHARRIMYHSGVNKSV